MRAVSVVLGLVAAIAIAAAGYVYSRHTIIYEQTATGTLKGRLHVEWIDQDTFVFVPDANEPLAFTRANKEVIQPGTMRTDGGSIPVALRAIKSYSPWGYAPAFIVHDWIFVMKHCKLPGHEKLDFVKAADVMAEVLKTMMESKRYGEPNKLVHYSMYEAVRSPTAQQYWDTGACTAVQTRSIQEDQTRARARSAAPAAAPSPAPPASGIKRYTIEFK